MLNQYTQWKFTRYQSTCVFPTSSSSSWNAEPFLRDADTQRWAAKHLGHTRYIGKRFANPAASSSAPCPQELNPWSSHMSVPIHSSTAGKNENQTSIQDQRCQSGPSAKKSVQRIMGQTNNDCRSQIFISTNSPHQQRLFVGRTRFKIEVCICSQFPTEAM